MIGGGPAGSTLATRLAMLGHDVCLVERAVFPRRHLGESLTPGVLPLLEATGARGTVERAGFLTAPRVDVMWDDGLQTRLDPREEGLLVDRGAFDLLLLQRAVDLGVRVLQPAQPGGWVQDEAGWLIRMVTPDGEQVVRAALLAEATGRSRMRASSLRLTAPRTLALSAYWRGPGLPDTPRIEAGRHGWFWRVPLPGGVCNTLAFVDPDHLRANRGLSLDAHLDALLAETGLMNEANGLERDGHVQAVDATPFLNEACVDASSLAVGDAALSLDPLSSSGLQKAIQTALAGAVVANTLIRRPSSAALAHQFYRDSLREASQRHHQWAASHYARMAVIYATPFWQRRAADAVPDALAPAAPPARPRADALLRRAVDTAFSLRPTLEADFVVEREVVTHPALAEPLAFLGGVHVAPALRALDSPLTRGDIMRRWQALMPPPTANAVLDWLVARGVVVEE